MTQPNTHRESLTSISQRRIQTVKSKGIYVLPNAFTALALFAAFYGIIAAMNSEFVTAAIAIFFSMLFDGMDGRVARLTHTQSEFGVQMDSLADAVSFGVAPGLIMYKYTLVNLGKIGYHCLYLLLMRPFTLSALNCNVGVVSKNYFQGLPSPAAAALVCGFVWLGAGAHMPEWLMSYQAAIGAVITLYAGLTMVSNAPFFSGKSYAVVKTVPFWFIVILSVLFVVISSEPSLAIFVLFCIYALSGYVYGFWCWWKGEPSPIQADIAKALAEKEATNSEET